MKIHLLQQGLYQRKTKKIPYSQGSNNLKLISISHNIKDEIEK